MSYIPQIEFYKKRPFSDKLNATFVFIRENAKPFFKAQLLVAGPILLLMTILVNQFSFDFMSLGLNPEGFAPDDFFRIFKLYGVVLVSGLITGAVMPAVTYSYMNKYQTIEPFYISNVDITKGLSYRVLQLIGLNILVFLILGGTAFVFALAIGFSATASVFLVFVFGLLLFVVVIYLAITMSLSTSILIFEQSNPLDAVIRSFKLITGKWWSTFGLVVIVGIIAGLISQLFGLPRLIFFGVQAFTSIQDGGDITTFVEMTAGQQALNVLFSVFETFGSIISNSIIFIAIAFQYFNLVERKESKGLMSQIESIDQELEAEDDEVY